MNPNPVAICLLAIALSSSYLTRAAADFDTIINSPPDEVPANVDSNTQVNVGPDGILGPLFTAGTLGASENIEINVSGGTVSGLTTLFEGAALNIQGGAHPAEIIAHGGSSIESVDATVNTIEINSGSTAQITGGSVGVIAAYSQAHAALIDVDADSVSVFSTGLIDIRNGEVGTALESLGGSISLDGVIVLAEDSLITNGGHLDVDDSTFQGLISLSNASLQVMHSTIRRDVLLQSSNIVFNSGDLFGLLDLRDESQGTIYVGVVAAVEVSGQSSVDIHDGTINTLDAFDGSDVAYRGGSLGDLFLFGDSTFAMTGGTINGFVEVANAGRLEVAGGVLTGDDVIVDDQSTLELSNGVIFGLVDSSNSDVTVSGGIIEGGLRALSGSTVEMDGGEVQGTIQIHSNASLQIAGGLFEELRILAGGQIELSVVRLNANGTDISGLERGIPLTIDERDVELTGLLADRTPFSLRLAQTGGGGSYIDTDALFSVVLVPEPTCQLGCLMAAFVLFARVRSGRNSR